MKLDVILNDADLVDVCLTWADVKELVRMCERWQRCTHDIEREKYFKDLANRLLQMKVPAEAAKSVESANP